MNKMMVAVLVAFVALAGSATGQIETCQSISLDSWKYRFASKVVEGANVVTGMRVTSKRSRSSCTLGPSFGYAGPFIYVNHGCRATFRVCYV
uniref:Hypothetical rhinophore protein n=1 Tax=Aplysia dactylomela TaxID=144766 RepID=E3UCE0_APLDA|nr:hypothetical rhinophore protein [Aplysia dactylomela]